MKPFDVTIAFRKNIGRHNGPPVWQDSERVERVFAHTSAEALRIAQTRTGGCPVACKCLWDR
jgi:hypothetical protein